MRHGSWFSKNCSFETWGYLWFTRRTGSHGRLSDRPGVHAEWAMRALLVHAGGFVAEANCL
jgi:streptogramin lyase